MGKPLSRYDDPSIERAAVHLVEEARAYVEAQIVKGRPWHVARDEFLRANASRWIAECGKDCADMAVRGVSAIGPREWLTKAGRRAENDHWRRYWLDHVRTTGRDGWLNRFWIRWFAAPLYGVAVAASLLLAVPPADASPRRAALAACAEARSDAERHQRRCWRFSAVERDTYRSYDRATSPRDWEKPRAWE